MDKQRTHAVEILCCPWTVAPEKEFRIDVTSCGILSESNKKKTTERKREIWEPQFVHSWLAVEKSIAAFFSETFARWGCPICLGNLSS